MDLESESSALESVDDNSVSQHVADDGTSFDNGSFSDESVKLVSTSKIDEVSNSGCSPISKGHGLRKWRRIRRDLVKDTSGNMDNSKVLKRGLSGSAHSNGKQVQFQSQQDCQGSVGSVNMLKSSGDSFETLVTSYDSRFVAGVDFSVDMGLENNDDRSSKSSTPVRALKVFRYEKPMISSGQRGVIRVENSKKHRGESVEIDKENSHSSLESDSRKQSGRMMEYDGEHGDMSGETSKKKDDAGGNGEESINKNSFYSEELDPLAEAIDGFLTLQEALEKEVQQLCGIGKEPIHHEGASIHHEGASEVSSEIVNLVNNVEQLEAKLEETRSMLEAKELHILELESTTNQNRHSWEGKKTVDEDIFKQRIESEIEYLIYSRSMDNLNSQMKSIEKQEALAEQEAHETLNKLGEVETTAANLINRAKDLTKECRETNRIIKKRAYNTASCFVIQLVLLVPVVLSFMTQLLPVSDIVVVPT